MKKWEIPIQTLIEVEKSNIKYEYIDIHTNNIKDHPISSMNELKSFLNFYSKTPDYFTIHPPTPTTTSPTTSTADNETINRNSNELNFQSYSTLYFTYPILIHSLTASNSVKAHDKDITTICVSPNNILVGKNSMIIVYIFSEYIQAYIMLCKRCVCNNDVILTAICLCTINSTTLVTYIYTNIYTHIYFYTVIHTLTLCMCTNIYTNTLYIYYTYSNRLSRQVHQVMAIGHINMYSHIEWS